MTEEEINKYLDENDEKVTRYVKWIIYQIGFTGRGPTAFDKKPDFEMPDDIPDEIKKGFIEEGKADSKHRWYTWVSVMREHLSEDISDDYECPNLG